MASTSELPLPTASTSELGVVYHCVEVCRIHVHNQHCHHEHHTHHLLHHKNKTDVQPCTFFGDWTLRHKDSLAPRNWCQRVQILRHQFFLCCWTVSWSLRTGLCALTRARLWKTTRLYCKIVLIVLFKPLSTFKVVRVSQLGKRKERQSIYIVPFIYYVHLKAFRHGSHSFTCKYTMLAFPS